ncbi:MAG: hypothetical protein HWD59_10870 [Coxiellaceae bacterium]|nr:MAG: hypothetical protein HWD59_10870 [Coxiellaceae bacterium]
MSNSDPFYCLGEEYLIHFHDKCHKLELWHAKSERLICSVDIRYINGGSSAEAMNVTKIQLFCWLIVKNLLNAT